MSIECELFGKILDESKIEFTELKNNDGPNYYLKVTNENPIVKNTNSNIIKKITSGYSHSCIISDNNSA